MELLRDKFRRALEGKGFSIRSFEKEHGLSHDSVGKFVRGKQGVRMDVMEKWCALLGFELDIKKNSEERRK